MTRRYSVAVTTAADGSVTAYLPTTGKARGKLNSIQYVKHGVTPFADTVDFAITDEETGETIWTEANVTASKVTRPRAATHTTAGVAATLDGTVAALDKITLVSRIKIAVTNGGDAKLGTFTALID